MTTIEDRLVIFDCDGVLVDSEVLVARVEVELLGGLGVHLTADQVLAEFVGLSEADMHGQIERRWQVVLPPEFVALKRQRIAAAIESELEAVPGIEKVVDGVMVKRCVASSSAPDRIRRSLTRVRLIELFDGNLFSATMVERGKPAPDLFLHAAATMGVEPGRCVVIEDSPLGVRAAVAAAMRVIGFVGGSHCRAEAAEGLRAAGAGDIAADAGELAELLGDYSGP